MLNLYSWAKYGKGHFHGAYILAVLLEEGLSTERFLKQGEVRIWCRMCHWEKPLKNFYCGNLKKLMKREYNVSLTTLNNYWHSAILITYAFPPFVFSFCFVLFA